MTSTGFCPARRSVWPSADEEARSCDPPHSGEVQDENAWMLKAQPATLAVFQCRDLLRFAGEILVATSQPASAKPDPACSPRPPSIYSPHDKAGRQSRALGWTHLAAVLIRLLFSPRSIDTWL